MTRRVLCWYSLEEVRGEFDDFQESSRELEAELEAQLEQAEAVNKDLLSRIHRLEEENDSLKVYIFDHTQYTHTHTHTQTHTHTNTHTHTHTHIHTHTSLTHTQNKVDAQQNEMFVTVSTLQEERTELLALKETLQKYIRQLEQTNDDLERGKRWANLLDTLIHAVTIHPSLPQSHNDITGRLWTEIKSGMWVCNSYDYCLLKELCVCVCVCVCVCGTTTVGVWKECDSREWTGWEAATQRNVPEIKGRSQRYIISQRADTTHMQCSTCTRV